MAEVAGLALGAVSVLSLVGAFKDCIDLFSMISMAQSLGRDFELLDTKLDVEKTLLLQWAERVRLLDEENYDKRLDKPATGHAVSRILASVYLLLSESDSLQNRYGMREAEKNENYDLQPIVSGNRMDRLHYKLQNLSLRVKDYQKQTPIRKKIRWVVQDREKFDALISELSHFISRLNILLPDKHGRIESMTMEDMSPRHGIQKLHMIIEASTGLEDGVASAADQAITKICQDRILLAVWFRMIDDRRDFVKEAHSRTLRWALSPPHNNVEWSPLADWFRSGSNLYWISGKAGSGKSTLMKHLWGLPEIKKLLKIWASDGSLILANFFFWHLGTTEQQSLEGLWRGLLYHVLESDPSLIPILLPRMWQEARTSEERLSTPTASEMETAFRHLSGGDAEKRYYCFFIDGLDEYSGNSIDGISFINTLVVNPNVKVLVSSRPIPTCVEAFASKPCLQLENLTRGDIQTYVDDQLGSSSYMQDLREADPAGADQVLSDIVDKASGVFLWVVLACRSIREGMASYDSASELQHRIDELPSELEDLFRHMLSKVEPRYQAQAVKFLRICYEFHRKKQAGLPRLPTIGLAITNDYDMKRSTALDPRVLSVNEMNTKCKVLEGRIRSRCCGILEIIPRNQNSDICFCKGKMNNVHDSLIDSTVEFLHRSVFEFLSTPGVWDMSCLQITDSKFQPSEKLASISLYLAQACQWAQDGDSKSKSKRPLTDYVKHSMSYARDADEFVLTSALSMSGYLSSLKTFLANYWPNVNDYSGHMRQVWEYTKGCSDIGLFLAAEVGLANFCSEQLREKASVLTSAQKQCILAHAVEQPILRNRCITLHKKLSFGVIKLLLAKGCNPNNMAVICCPSIHSSGPWLKWLNVHAALRSADDMVEAALLFIEAGASLEAVLSEFDKPLESLLVQDVSRFANYDEQWVGERLVRLKNDIKEKRSALA